MSTHEIVPGVVIPDKVTPEVGWRVWRTERKHGRLCPVHVSSSPWLAGAPTEAQCVADREPPRAWIPVPIEEAVESGEMTHREWFRSRKLRQEFGVRPPRTFLPDTMRFVWRKTPDVHEPPDAACRCGLYATADVRDCADQLVYGPVVGTVALWGKVVPGDKGWRAQFAYPTELFVVTGKRFTPPASTSSLWMFSTAMRFSTRADEADLNKGDAVALADRLSERYAVPCSVIDDWQRLA